MVWFVWLRHDIFSFPIYSQVVFLFFVNFGDGNWRQAEACIVFLSGEVEVNALAQEAVRQFTQWLWIEHPIFQLRGRHFTTELFTLSRQIKKQNVAK